MNNTLQIEDLDVNTLKKTPNKEEYRVLNAMHRLAKARKLPVPKELDASVKHYLMIEDLADEVQIALEEYSQTLESIVPLCQYKEILCEK